MDGKKYLECSQVCSEISRFIGYLDEDMILRLQIAIKRLPPARCMPAVLANWIDTGPDMMCSNCDFTCNDFYYLGSANFCPNCGAKMEEA